MSIIFSQEQLNLQVIIQKAPAVKDLCRWVLAVQAYHHNLKNLLPIKEKIRELKDQINGDKRELKIRITPNRNVNRYDIFASEEMILYNFKANEVQAIGQKGEKYDRKRGKKILSYYRR